MKKIIPIILTALLFFSCEDFLEVDPVNEVVIKHVDDVKSTLGHYLFRIVEPFESREGSGRPYLNDQLFSTDIMFYPDHSLNQLCMYQSDEVDSDLYPSMGYLVYGRTTSAAYEQGVKWELTESQERIWKKAYRAIGFFNSLLDELKHIEGDQYDKEVAKGELLTLRAFHIFKLLQFFAPYTNNELGIPLNIDADKVADYEGSRWTHTEVYNLLIDDLTEVLSYESEPEHGYNIFYSRSVAHAILAQVYHYKGLSPAKASDDWSNARTHAEEVLKEQQLVSDRADYLPVYHNANKNVVEKDSPHALLVFYWGNKWIRSFMNYWGRPMYGHRMMNGLPIADDLTNAYSDSDIRLLVGPTPPSNQRDYTGAFIFKNTTTGLNFSTKYPYVSRERNYETLPLFRAEEMHLIVAEAYAREGNQAKASEFLSAFKLAKNAGESQNTDVLDEILLERRKEFISEYDVRWLDMKRTGHSFSRNFVHPVDGEQTYTIEENDYRYSFRIPDSELTYNRKLNQNPGW